MDRTLEHLRLNRTSQSLQRRKRAGGRPPQRSNKESHGQQLLKETEELSNKLRARQQQAPVGIDPKLIFKIILHPQGNIDEEKLRQLDLGVLGIDPEKALVVFPNEASLERLQRRLREYSGLVPDGHAYEYLSSIESIAELTPADRTGSLLRERPLIPGESVALDVELWHTGDDEECRQNITEISDFLLSFPAETNGGRRFQSRITDQYVGSSLCVVRATLNSNALVQLLAGFPFDYIKEIDRRPSPTFDFWETRRVSLDELHSPTSWEASSTADDLIGIVVIDSGVSQQHPLIAPALDDAQVFPDGLSKRIHGGPDDGDVLTGGHGTAVAGLAVYGDIGDCIRLKEFVPTSRLFSARVTDHNNEYDEDSLIENQLEAAVTYFVENYDQAKVVNISLGNHYSVLDDHRYQFRFAAVVDDLAYRYRDLNVVFVVSTGNYVHESDDQDDLLEHYPNYLLDSGKARLIDPATSAIALTVGGLSYGAGSDDQSDELTERLVAGHKHWPSPFTRTGWGYAGAIKPEVVEFAGDLRFSHGRVPGKPAYAGMPTTAKAFAPPEGTLFRTVAGTSFAAPRISNLASRLIREFPNASSNLIRALILDSAQVPTSRPPCLENLKDADDQILRLYGYGLPDFQRARWSTNNNVLLLEDGTMPIDTFELFEIPPLPDEFISAKGNGYLSVTLVFDPPTRHTRADSYLGVTMQFDLFRNVSQDAVANALKHWNPEEKQGLGSLKIPTKQLINSSSDLPAECSLLPKTVKRSKGTAQKGVMKISGAAWKYDRQPLILAVICQRKWAPLSPGDQRFAVVVSLSHENEDVQLYAHLTQHARQFQQVQLRV